MDVPDMPGGDPDGQLGRLAASARGWHRVQLAALGFIGLCGVLWSAGESWAPEPVKWTAAGLALVAIVLQGVAVYLVGSVAFPFYGVPGGSGAGGADPGGDGPSRAAKSRRLRTGIRLTYLAVGLVVVATLSAWWPRSDSGDTGVVEAVDAAGTSVCGELVGGSGAQLELDTADGRVAVPLDAVAELRPVTSC